MATRAKSDKKHGDSDKVERDGDGTMRDFKQHKLARKQ